MAQYNRANDVAIDIGDTIANALLDSSLIVTTKNSYLYNIKLVNCGDYTQVYYLEKNKLKKDKLENLKKIDTDNLRSTKDKKKEETILLKNIIRSKLECQRLAKANSKEWKTFITLTIAENITDIKIANKKFRNFIDIIKRQFKDFKYIAIPEFQKRGAVHYHILTNIDINNKDFIYEQADNKKYKHIKYWNYGFTKVDVLEKDIKKIVGYISKYMTKDIDNRLYNRHRYFISRNLKKATINYLDLSNLKHLEYYNKYINNSNLIYENQYYNTYDSSIITFHEYLSKEL